jgi:gentisate 1,2-dioxygenase
VNGVKLTMRPGDVLLTPNWHWHGHGNESLAPAYWIDFLDTPLIHALEPMFFEPHPESYEPVVQVVTESPMRFAWSDSVARFATAPQTPDAPYATQILLGNPAMATISLSMMRLQSGVETAPHRTTANNIYAVAQGAGASVIDGQSFDWSRGDVIAVPAWRPHSHCACEDAVLLRVSDEPVLQKLDLLRRA